MVENRASTEDEQRLAELYDAWTYFDDTGDESAILPILADDVVVLPPDHDPIIGMEAAEDWYTRVDPSNGEWSSQNREIVLGSDLAVNWMTTDGELQGDQIQFQGMAIYEKRDGKWKLRFDIWNRSE